MLPFDPLEHNFRVNRRQFFRQNAMGLGGIALGSLLAGGVGRAFAAGAPGPGLPPGVHFPAKAKRCIYLSMIGAPSRQPAFTVATASPPCAPTPGIKSGTVGASARTRSISAG